MKYKYQSKEGKQYTFNTSKERWAFVKKEREKRKGKKREKSKSRAWTDKDVKQGKAPYTEEDVKRGYIKGTESKEQKTIHLNKKQEGTKYPETIELEPKKRGIAEYREREGFLPNVVEAMTSWKTTIALGATLATLLTAGAATGAIGGTALSTGGRALITRTATRYAGRRVATMTTQRAFIGKAGTSGVDKLFKAGGYLSKNAPVAARYAVNGKTTSLTKKLFMGLGFTALGASVAKDLVGTYPFASFVGKEEAAQTLGIVLWSAIQNGDLEGAGRILEASNELTTKEPELMDKIPYLNVQNAVKDNIEQVKIANVEWARIIELLKKESQEPTFAEERATADEEARERKLGYREEDKEYYEGLREEEEERKAKESESYEQRRTENAEKEARKREMEMEIWRLRREKRWDEADELERQLIEMIKSGEL